MLDVGAAAEELRPRNHGHVGGRRELYRTAISRSLERRRGLLGEHRVERDAKGSGIHFRRGRGGSKRGASLTFLIGSESVHELNADEGRSSTLRTLRNP